MNACTHCTQPYCNGMGHKRESMPVGFSGWNWEWLMPWLLQWLDRKPAPSARYYLAIALLVIAGVVIVAAVAVYYLMLLPFVIIALFVMLD